MSVIPKRERSNSVLVFAPNGRDAQLAVSLLGQVGISAEVCPAYGSLAGMLGPHTTFLIVAEETMRQVDLSGIVLWMETQPAWSDLPVIVLTQRGGGPESNPSAARLMETLGNVTFLERPFHPTTFASVARTALKARRRQYDARDMMEDLKESGERLSTALLAGQLGDWEYDIATGQLITSELCRAHYGRPEHVPLPFREFLGAIHPDDAARVREAIIRTLDTGEVYSIEYRVIWPDGSLRWVQVNASVVQDGAGRPTRVVGVSSEITGRKMAEENLRQMNESLESRVAERTSELQRAHAAVIAEIRQREEIESQLRQAQKMEMIGQLTGGVAHDFNNLLMAVLGNLDLLRKHLAEDPRAQRLIDGALQGARRGAALTQRLLAFARRQSLQVEPADMATLLDGMTDLLGRSVGPTITLTFDEAAGVPPALVDRNQVELALLNLAVNARDAMPDGGTLSIAVEQYIAGPDEDLAAGPYVRIAVTDTGCGMDEETLQRAIEPFFSTKELGKGTGLGLSMIHGLAVQLNGALRLSSKPGVGTRAELYLPASAGAEEAPVAVAPEPVIDASTTSRARILVVDDDALISMSTVDMLEDLGHDVIEVNSGAQALEAFGAGGEVDLVITDFAMPGMTGVQLAKALHAIAPDLPILLATGYAELPPGSDLHIARIGKPYSQEQLAREIAKLLPSTSAPDGAHA